MWGNVCAQAATGVAPPGGGQGPPREGDGFTYEHLSAKEELWVDFCADTGDGGDPTYAVARAMAAPVLHVRQGAAAEGGAGEAAAAAQEEAADDCAASPRSAGTESSSGLDTPTRGARSLRHAAMRCARCAGDRLPVRRRAPRACSVLLWKACPHLEA